MITGKPRRAISKWPRIYSFFWFPHLPVLFFTLSPLSSTTLFFHLVFFSVLSTSSSQSSSPPSFSSLCFYCCRVFPQISPHSLAVISFLSHVFFSSLLALASFFPPILISFFCSISSVLSFVSLLLFPAFWNISAHSGLSNHPQILPTIHLFS